MLHRWCVTHVGSRSICRGTGGEGDGGGGGGQHIEPKRYEQVPACSVTASAAGARGAHMLPSNSDCTRPSFHSDGLPVMRLTCAESRLRCDT